MKKKLNPNDLVNFNKVGAYNKISIDTFVREANKNLKKTLLEASLEANGVKIELTTTKTRFGGEKFWFICPNCKRRCGALYILNFLSNTKCNLCLKKNKFTL